MSGHPARIAADGLAIVEQRDGLAIRRNLYRTEPDPLGHHAAKSTTQLRSAQANSHAIGPVIDPPRRIEGPVQAATIELGNLAPGNRASLGGSA